MTGMLYTQDVDGTPWTAAKAAEHARVVSDRRLLIQQARAVGAVMPWDADLLAAAESAEHERLAAIDHAERMRRRGPSR